MPKLGRKPTPLEQRYFSTTIALTQRERKSLDEGAERLGLSRSEYARRLLRRAAE